MFKHGFKSFCENLALNFRKQLKIASDAPIDIHLLSEHLHVSLLTPKDIAGLSNEAIRILLISEASDWSALTISRNNNHLVIYNSAHSLSRQTNDITHELSHIILDHRPQSLHSYETGIFLRHFDESQEEEANWLAATILLPKDALFNIKKTKLTNTIAANMYCVSESLVKMRLDVSGINRIFENTRKKYKKTHS